MGKSTTATQQVSTRLPGDVRATLKAFAKDHGLKIEYVISQALREYLKRKGSA